MENGITEIGLEELVAMRHSSQQFSLRFKQRILNARVGGYLSKHRGRGMDYAESRIYQAGDDIRHMDWRVTARAQKPHTKLYHEEKERPVYLVMDFGPSMFFATQNYFKSVLAAKVAALFAWSIVENGDRLGGYFYSGKHHLELKPYARQKGALQLLQKMTEFQHEKNEEQNLEHMEQHWIRFSRIIKPGSLVIWLSDFLNLSENQFSLLSKINKHNTFLMGMIYDPVEVQLPPPNVYAIKQQNEILLLDTHSKKTRKDYKQQFEQRKKLFKDTALKLKAHQFMLNTQQDIFSVLRNELRLK